MIKRFAFLIAIIVTTNFVYANETEIVDDFLENATYRIRMPNEALARENAKSAAELEKIIAKQDKIKAKKIEAIKRELRQALIDGYLGMEHVGDKLEMKGLSHETTDFLVDNIDVLLTKITWFKGLALGNAFDLSYFLDHDFMQDDLELFFMAPTHLDMLEHNIEHLNSDLKIQVHLFGSRGIPKLSDALKKLNIEFVR